MSEFDFFVPRFTGKRFDNHSLPLDVLSDLATFEDFLFDVAKYQYRCNNPDSTRCPPNFWSGMGLTLSEVKEGSAKTVLKLATAASLLFPDIPALNYLKSARNAISMAIHAVEKNEPPTDHIPVHLLKHFEGFGKSLREKEAMELPLPGGTAVSHLTRETRKKLLLVSEQVKTYTENATVFGHVSEVDQKRESFEILTIFGNTVSGRIEEEHRMLLVDALRGYPRRLFMMQVCI